MDDDGEMDSQSELVGSLSCWMMRNLSQHAATSTTKPSDKLSLSLPDTVLLQDGHLFHWLFSKSGTIVKVCVTSDAAPRLLTHEGSRWVLRAKIP